MEEGAGGSYANLSVTSASNTWRVWLFEVPFDMMEFGETLGL